MSIDGQSQGYTKKTIFLWFFDLFFHINEYENSITEFKN